MSPLAIMAVCVGVAVVVLVQQTHKRGLGWDYLLLPNWMKEWASPVRPRWFWHLIIPLVVVLCLLALMMQSLRPPD